MADDVTPDQVRARRFDMVRRGYDRAQVDEFLQDLASQLEDLRSRVTEAKASALAIGIDDPEALANELKSVGGEVGAVLEAARAAAEGLRTRAAKDADAWRTEAERDSTAMVDDASEQSQSMRASAWNEGTSMLSSAEAEAQSLVEKAQEDALFMRAEAERDALRLTSDARRDKEELLRVAQLDSESIIQEARSESDGVLAAANKQAEAAQERARALEDRRSELLSELEATRTSISQLEDEIDSRRQALETPEPLLEPETEPRTHHAMDSGSVKIVAPSKVVALRPVDADEFVADVEAIRSASNSNPEDSPQEQEPETVAVIAPPPVREVAVDEPVDVVEEQDDPPLVEVADEDPADSSDEIGSLFAKLRDDTAEEPVVQAVDTEREPEQEPTPAREPEPAASKPPPAPHVAEPETPVAEASVAPTSETQTGTLAAQNVALKAIKRSLVELQNETLEALRADEAWVPEEGFTNRFEESFGAFGEAVGSDSAADTGSAFASDLHDAVASAIQDERGHGSGSRAVASAASKVFRTWRSDEAERRLLVLVP